MSFERAKEDLEKKGFGDHILHLGQSTATVEEAARTLGVQPGAIAKTMAFFVHEQPIVILTEGDARIDNHKYKAYFKAKAKMIPPADVEAVIGHAPGGVCPFGINPGVRVYLDVSLKRFAVVYPAAGDDHSAVRLTIDELEKCVSYVEWIDVCVDPAAK